MIFLNEAISVSFLECSDRKVVTQPVPSIVEQKVNKENTNVRFTWIIAIGTISDTYWW